MRRYAEGLLKQYDANKNGVLDKDEWTQVRTITPDTDANKDGAVTIEELTAKLSGFGQQGAGASSGSSGSSTSSDRLELKKYCPRCNKHVVHKETK